MYMSKTSISSRIHKFYKGALIIFPLDGQIKGEVVVGTTYPLVGCRKTINFQGSCQHLKMSQAFGRCILKVGGLQSFDTG